MKPGKLLTAMTVVAVTLSVQCIAQPAPPAGPKDRRPPEEMREQALQTVSAYNGQAGEWTTNDDYVYDGFYLQAAQGKFLVKFPPHMGSQLTKSIKAGTTITVNGTEQVNPEGVKEIRLISVTANGQTIADAPPASLPAPAEEPQVTGSGKVTAFQKNREGAVSGYIIDGKTILRVPPHAAAQLNAMITNGATVSYSGMKKTAGNGEASNGNYSIVHCQTITVNGTQYLTR